MTEHESKFIEEYDDEALTALPYLVCDLDQVDEICDEYLADCANESMDPSEQKLELQLASFGDEEAKLLIFNSNKRRAIMAARNYSGRGVEFDDLVQEGSIALLSAIETFDQKRGSSFSDYANLLIQRSMINALIDHSRTIRIAKHMFDSLGELYTLDKQANNDLSVEDVSNGLSIKPEKAEKIMQVNQQSIVSIDEIDSTLLDKMILSAGLVDSSSEDIVDQRIDKSCKRQDLLNSMSGVLSDREKKVILMRFGFDTGEKQILEEVGSQMGVTRQFISKIEKRSIKKLQKFYDLS